MATLGTTTAQSIVAQAVRMGEVDLAQIFNASFASPASGATARAAIAQNLPYLKPRQQAAILMAAAQSPTNPWSSTMTDAQKLALLNVAIGTVAAAEATQTAGAGSPGGSNAQSGNLVATLATLP
jgi:hypothetical protein